ncbi:hypothetical protein HYZ70_02580 [Candidatus Curtissbacteria bacterium]|nr:hypothetical protein [Candidatus Curtissbacteria bacterium]
MKRKRIKGLEKYSDQWVAIDEKKSTVITGGKSLKEVMREAVKIIDKPTYMRVPPLDVSFSP